MTPNATIGTFTIVEYHIYSHIYESKYMRVNSTIVNVPIVAFGVTNKKVHSTFGYCKIDKHVL